MHLCPFCNRRTINLLDDDDDDVQKSILSVYHYDKTSPTSKLYTKLTYKNTAVPRWFIVGN